LINFQKKQNLFFDIGFHSGPAVGGIVGARNLQYCLFGDTVNTVKSEDLFFILIYIFFFVILFKASRITTTGDVKED